MRTLIILTLAQSFAQTGMPIVILLGGIVGGRIAPSPELATLPVALAIVGTALTTVPAALLMSRIGRKAGFLLGAAYASASGVLAAFAVAEAHFWLFCVATALVGSNNAFIQQYRFAVADSVPSERVGPALSALMLAGVVAAWLGPEVANRFHYGFAWGEFTGSFIGLAGLMACAFIVLLFYPDKVLEQPGETGPAARPLGAIARQPVFLAAVGAAVVGYGVMSLMMTATPVAMHTHDAFDLDATSWVIQSHIMAMFLPSLFSGILVARFGAFRVIAAGLFLMFCCVAIAWLDRSLIHYWGALVLLGVGWNFLFVGGTSALTLAYRPAERFKVQALNDALVFGLQAVAALGSGVILAGFGWVGVLALSLPWLLLLMPLLWLATRPTQGSPA